MSTNEFNLRVLVADDSAAQRACVRQELQTLGLEVAEASNGIEALRLVHSFKPDLVTLDIEMPTLNGYRVLDQLRAQEPTMTLPVIMVSGRPSEAERLRSLEAGAFAYFTKPFPKGELCKLVSELLARVEANRETTIYCVEPDEDMRAQIAARLKTHGYRCHCYASATDLLTALGDASCDVLLLDLHLPHRETYQILDYLKQEPRHLATAPIGLTRFGDRKDIVNAFQMGVADFIRKPFYGEELLARVEHLLHVKRTQSHLERIAAVDPLTELPNRGELNRHFDIEVARALRDQTSLGILMIDIDHFKRVNDERGHPAGDRVLHAVAQCLRNELRVTDVIGRYGGEEFSVVLPNAKLSGVEHLAERLRRAVENLPIDLGKDEVAVTVSIGGALWSYRDLAVGFSRDALVQPADAALYRAKHGGRNQVRVSGRDADADERAPESSAFLSGSSGFTGTDG
jgi:two-component system cell cycle response regulator